ncbi:hypothetical protein AB0I77_15180 [Streptomyces sp. NPDC050619]|uniref:hypothetical protein n=1 Tax=Streptomyces sp. NPDC050619 TaxID=3157214 RepID=UPI00341A5964
MVAAGVDRVSAAARSCFAARARCVRTSPMESTSPWCAVAVARARAGLGGWWVRSARWPRWWTAEPRAASAAPAGSAAEASARDVRRPVAVTWVG